MQRASGEERMFRVPYGDGELEFMLQPWFDVVIGPASGEHDIVVAGVGRPDDIDLGRMSRAATRLVSRVRQGGALVIAAQLDEGAGSDAGPEHSAQLDLALERCLIVVAASEAPELVRLAKMRAAVDVEEGLDIAYEHIGRPARASVLVMPR